jgi:hypothetical protein
MAADPAGKERKRKKKTLGGSLLTEAFGGSLGSLGGINGVCPCNWCGGSCVLRCTTRPTIKRPHHDSLGLTHPQTRLSPSY